MNRIERIEYTRTELLGQPRAIEETLAAEQERRAELAARLAERDIRRIQVLGSGDSFCVAEAIAGPWRRWLDLPVLAVQSLEHAYETVTPQTLVIAISAMGGAGATLDAVHRGQEQGGYVLTVTNTIASPTAQEATAILPVHATRIGWPTQSTTAAIAALLALGAAWAMRRGASPELQRFSEDLGRLPETVADVLAASDEPSKALAERWIEQPALFFAGTGAAYTAGRLGAAKIKEMSQDHASAMFLEEYHHYYSVKTGEAFFLLAPPGPGRERARETVESARRVGADIVVLTSDDAVVDVPLPQLELPAVSEPLNSIIYSLPLQIFAQHLGMLKQRPEWALQDGAGRPLVARDQA
jgi:glucosamine--fructose-6-phosphate aminotransferase (isomerizing)